MNVKLITKAMHTLSLLSEDDVAMVMKLRGLSEDERQMLMLVLEPQKPGQKKSSKKSAGKGGGGKSKHASSLQQQMTSTLKPLADVVNQPRCTAMIDDNGGEMECGLRADDNVHHIKSTDGYHEFQGAKETGATA